MLTKMTLKKRKLHALYYCLFVSLCNLLILFLNVECGML